MVPNGTLGKSGCLDNQDNYYWSQGVHNTQVILYSVYFPQTVGTNTMTYCLVAVWVVFWLVNIKVTKFAVLIKLNPFDVSPCYKIL